MSVTDIICKHCMCTFKRKYNFQRHLTSCKHDNVGFVPAKYVLAQYNTWVQFDKVKPIYCESCFKIFSSRQCKSRHVLRCDGKIVEENKEKITNYEIEKEKAFMLMIGKIRDRAFSIDFTYQDIKKRIGLCCFTETLINQDLAFIIKEIYINHRHRPLFDVLDFASNENVFKIYEYIEWIVTDRNTVISALLYKAVLLLNGFKCIDTAEYTLIIDNIQYKTLLKDWLDSLNDDGDNNTKINQRQNLSDLFV